MFRKRTCESCKKPLGSTTHKCFECGGTSPDRHGDSLESARQWKLMLGVKPKLIDEAHAESDYNE